MLPSMLGPSPDPDATRVACNPQQASLRFAHSILERELGALLRPEVLDALLAARMAELAAMSCARSEAPLGRKNGGDAGQSLRVQVGADLLDAIADALARVAAELPACPAGVPPAPEPAVASIDATRCLALSASDARRARERSNRRWTPGAELSRRVG